MLDLGHGVLFTNSVWTKMHSFNLWTHCTNKEPVYLVVFKRIMTII